MTHEFVILNDGETFTNLFGCYVLRVDTDDLTADQLLALEKGGVIDGLISDIEEGETKGKLYSVHDLLTAYDKAHAPDQIDFQEDNRSETSK